MSATDNSWDAGVNLPYPDMTFGPEFTSTILFIVLDSTRLSLGSCGNKAESLPQLVLMNVLSCPLLAFYIYFMSFQVYVCVSSVPTILLPIALGFRKFPTCLHVYMSPTSLCSYEYQWFGGLYCVGTAYLWTTRSIIYWLPGLKDQNRTESLTQNVHLLIHDLNISALDYPTNCQREVAGCSLMPALLGFDSSW